MSAKGKAVHAVNKSGQVLGQKGLSTQIRIIKATESLLAQSRGVEPSAAVIARAAGISAPTFYLYFADVGEAVLAVVEQLGERFKQVVALAEAPWPRDEVLTRAHTLVKTYFDYWFANAPGLRARNRFADRGDGRFLALRVASTDELMLALARKISDPPYPGGLPCAPEATAAVLVTALERIATVCALDLYPLPGLNVESHIGALTNMVAAAARGGDRVN